MVRGVGLHVNTTAHFSSICTEMFPCVQVRSFFGKHQDSAGIERSMRLEAEQSIERNIEWISHSRDDIVSWLRQRY